MDAGMQVVVGQADAVMRQRMVETLERNGYAVREATDGLELVDQIESLAQGGCRHNLVIVSDVHMSGLSGLDVLTVLRCARWRVPMILIGEESDDEDIRDATQLGAVVLTRPLRDEALLQQIHDARSHEVRASSVRVMAE